MTLVTSCAAYSPSFFDLHVLLPGGVHNDKDLLRDYIFRLPDGKILPLRPAECNEVYRIRIQKDPQYQLLSTDRTFSITSSNKIIANLEETENANIHHIIESYTSTQSELFGKIARASNLVFHSRKEDWMLSLYRRKDDPEKVVKFSSEEKEMFRLALFELVWYP